MKRVAQGRVDGLVAIFEDALRQVSTAIREGEALRQVDPVAYGHALDRTDMSDQRACMRG
jgi:hypothetical protein